MMLTKIEGRRRGGQQRMKFLGSITDAVDMNLGKLWEMMRDREVWHAVVYGVVKSQTQLGNWITTTTKLLKHWQKQREPRQLQPQPRSCYNMQFNKNTSATHALALNIGPRGHYWLLILLPPNLDVTTTAPPLLKWILHCPWLLAIKMSYYKFWENVPDCLSLDHMCIP